MPEHTFLPARRAFSTSTARRALAALATLLALASATVPALAANDVARWNETAVTLLPGFVGTVAFTAGTPNQYVITVTWKEPDIDTNATYALTVYT